jgi:hypothetical protein
MAKNKIPETAVGTATVELLRSMDWKVYQEVSEGWSSSCDIVAKDGDYIHSIECKTTLNLRVIEQVMRWTTRSHYCSIAIPERTLNHEQRRIIEKLGFGLYLIVRNTEWINNKPVYGYVARESIKPKLNENIGKITWEKFLHDEYADSCIAGSRFGNRITPFKVTSNNISQFVKEHPGCNAKEVIAGISHHYKNLKSAPQTITKLIERKIIKDIRIDIINKKKIFFPI